MITAPAALKLAARFFPLFVSEFAAGMRRDCGEYFELELL